MPRPVIRTYLELTDPGAVRPAAAPRVAGHVEIAKVAPPDGATSRWFYLEVGRPHQWTDNLHRTDAEWQAWADAVETWVATVERDRARCDGLKPSPEAP